MLFIKTIRFLWPFLKELFLGNKTLKEALRLHLGRVLVIAVFLASLGVNFVLVPRLLKISFELVELKRDHAKLQKRLTEVLQQRYPNADFDVRPEPAPLPTPAQAASAAAAAEARQFFDRIREKERHH